MRRGLSLLGLAFVSAASIAAAQTARLSAEQARRALTECIEPEGRTVDRRGGEVQEGRLEIRPDGQACFNDPPESAWSCFAVTREGENYRCDAFVTRAVRRGVPDCGAAHDAHARLGADS